MIILSTPVESTLGLFATAFDAVFGWFTQILFASGAVGVYLCVFAMVCVVRFLIVPIIGKAFTEEVGED